MVNNCQLQDSSLTENNEEKKQEDGLVEIVNGFSEATSEQEHLNLKRPSKSGKSSDDVIIFSPELKNSKSRTSKSSSLQSPHMSEGKGKSKKCHRPPPYSMWPLTVNRQQKLIFQYLIPLGEYQEVISFLLSLCQKDPIHV